MYRGTTPTLIFALPFNAENISTLNIAFAQNRKVVLEKTLRDCQTSEKQITLKLTEQETLRFSAEALLEIQLRCVYEGNHLASNIICTDVNRILKDGAL